MKSGILLAAAFFLTFAASTSHASGACQLFSGDYTVGPSGCFESHDGSSYPDHEYTGVSISADASDSLAMRYDTEGTGFTVNYIADGQEHTGDQYNSGKTYTASCDSSQITTTRVGLFIAPMDTVFAKNSDGTYTLTETVAGAHSFTRSCSMVRN